MSVDDRNREKWTAQLEARGRAIDQSHDLKGGGGGGTSDGMDGRVSKLENDIAALRVEIAKGFGDLKATLAEVNERTKHMATKWEVVVILGVMAGLIGGIVALTARFLPS